MFRIYWALPLFLLRFFSPADPPSETPGMRPPVAAANAYVNTKLCSGCHPRMFQTYRQTGMGRSFSRALSAPRVEDFTHHNHYYHARSDTHYVMLRRGDELYQRRYQIGYNGQETNLDEKRIDFVMGSGTHARTYLHQTALGTLMELPLGWYAEKGGYWAMSPGYDFPQHPGSERLIGYDCMFCHNSYPQTPTAAERFGELPRYTGTLPEGIDCQRCHGPGQQHIAATQRPGATAEEIRGAILNPAHLTADRQTEVCMQCHLQPDSLHPTTFKRYGRGYFSYQPREPLSNFLLFFDTVSHESPERFQIASSVYRLRQSACFLQSGGKLQCTTCHNPHEIRHGAEATTTYNQICQRCHASALPGLVAAGRHPTATNCIDCHMPKRRTQDVVHVVMTDHYIQRHRPAADLLADLAERHDTAVPTGPAVPYYPRLLAPTADNRLALAVEQVRVNPSRTQGLASLARRLPAERPRSPDPYFEIAEAYRRFGPLTEAVRWYQEALHRDSQYLSALLGLSTAWNDLGQRVSAVETLRRGLELAPADARLWHALGRVELDRNHPPEAMAAFQKAIALDPDWAPPHNLLSMLLGRNGDLHEAAAELREAIRIQPNSGEAHGNLANLLGLQGDLPQAGWEFRETIRLQPSDVQTRLDYAALLYTLHEDNEAQQQAETALQIQPSRAEAHHVRGNILEHKGQLQEAFREYREAVRLQPELSRAQLDLGAVLAQTGQKADAVPHLKRALASEDANVRRIARQLLDELGAP